MEKIILCVKVPNGRSICVHALPSDTVLDVKKSIEKDHGPPEIQRYIYNAKPMQNDRTLESYGVQSYSNIHLCYRMLSCKCCPGQKRKRK